MLQRIDGFGMCAVTPVDRLHQTLCPGVCPGICKTAVFVDSRQI
jgi:hypothetical protein